MKKILTVALVALLATASVFAGLSGKATLNLGYDFESGDYGFLNGKAFNLDLDVASETAEKAGEGDVYAGVKATMTLKAANRAGSNAAIFVKDGAANIGLGFLFSLKEAYIAGADWKVSITGTQNGPDFAKSAIDSVLANDGNDGFGKDAFGNKKPHYYWNRNFVADSYSVSVNKAPVITATYKDWSVAAGFNGGKANATTGAPEFFNYHVSAISPAITVAEGLTVKAAAVASGKKDATEKVGENKIYKEDLNYDAFGASTEVAYASDAFSAKVAADFGMKKTVGTDEFKPGFDIAANASYAPVTVDAYFKRVDDANYLSAMLSAEHEGISGDVFAQDLTGEDITIGADAAYEVEAYKVSLGGWMTTNSKMYEINASAEYRAEMFTAAVGATFGATVDADDSAYLRLDASVETDKLIPGATLSLAYSPLRESADHGKYTTNLLKEKYGSVDATCTIKF